MYGGSRPRRHAMFVNQLDETVVVPLNVELECDAKLELANSSLSEFAVMAVGPVRAYRRSRCG